MYLQVSVYTEICQMRCWKQILDFSLGSHGGFSIPLAVEHERGFSVALTISEWSVAAVLGNLPRKQSKNNIQNTICDEL